MGKKCRKLIRNGEKLLNNEQKFFLNPKNTKNLLKCMKKIEEWDNLSKRRKEIITKSWEMSQKTNSKNI